MSRLRLTHGLHLALNPALSERAATGLFERLETFIRVFAIGFRELCLLLAFIFPNLWCIRGACRGGAATPARWRRPEGLASPGRALSLISGKPPLWSVVAANAAAVQAGVRLGMTKAQVAEFCTVEIRHRSEAQEQATHAALLDVGWSISPRVEDTAADTIVRRSRGARVFIWNRPKISRVNWQTALLALV